MSGTALRRPAALLALALAAAGAFAACGSSTTPTVAPGATQEVPGGLTTPAAAVTQPPLPTLDPEFSFALPSEDKELEALLPDEIAGGTVAKSSMAGASLVGSDTSGISKVLQGLKKTPDDLSAAFGSGGGVSVSAYRLKGVEASALLTAFIGLLSAEEAPTVSDATIGGKAVKQVVVSGQTMTVYTHDDVLFTIAPIGSGKDAAVAEAISKLP